MLRLAFLPLVLALSALGAQAASAEAFVWKDAKGGFTMSFPDTWRLQTPDVATTMLRIAGPVAEDRATCRMQVSEDGRALMYPKRLVGFAVQEMLNEEFYRDEIAQYANAQLTAFYSPSSMGGKGDATAARYVFNDNGTPMYGIMIGSLYGEHRYVASCSSRLDVFNRWGDVFAGILGSIELKDKYHPFAVGYYRDFLADAELQLPRVKPGTTNDMTYDIKKYAGREQQQ